MNSQRVLTLILCLFMCGQIVRAQDMDTELSKLTEDLAGKIKANGSKKITVLDFTDLQGGASELGKYIAEQLTVNFVMTKRDFSVLDRANLKSILAEHKLTATGLVDPENAKQLGKFAGVDALVIGNIIPIGTNITLAVKIITTETAEVVGGAKSKFKADDIVQQFLSQPAATTDATGATQTPKTPPQKPFGDLQARVESLRLNPGDQFYGYISFSVIITNLSSSDTYGVAVDQTGGAQVNLSNNREETFDITELAGIKTASQSFNGYSGGLSDVPPKSAIIITGKGQVRWNGKPGDYRPYRLQTGIVFGAESNGRHPDLKTYNLVLDVK